MYKETLKNMKFRKIFINLLLIFIPIKSIRKKIRYNLNNKTISLQKTDFKLPKNILNKIKTYNNKYFYKINKTINGGGGIMVILTLIQTQKIQNLL